MVAEGDELAGMRRLLEVMAILRGPAGCAWDRAQDFASIAPYTLEEAHEVADAIQRGNMVDLCEELGDLLLQVVFHAQIAAEAGHFGFADVAAGIVAKMERRHPHIFGDAAERLAADAVKANWEALKEAEKPRVSALDGVAVTLPALLRAQKISARAARTGFDWPDADGALAKVHEELGELAAARTDAERDEEAGDLLFAMVSYLRHLGVESETALRLATAKFDRRFRAIETTEGFAALSLEAKDALWKKVKRMP